VANIPATIQITRENGPSRPAVIADAMYISAPITDPTMMLVTSKSDRTFLNSMAFRKELTSYPLYTGCFFREGKINSLFNPFHDIRPADFFFRKKFSDIQREFPFHSGNCGQRS
jgi:hypothetical protein